MLERMSSAKNWEMPCGNFHYSLLIMLFIMFPSQDKTGQSHGVDPFPCITIHIHLNEGLKKH